MWIKTKPSNRTEPDRLGLRKETSSTRLVIVKLAIWIILYWIYPYILRIYWKSRWVETKEVRKPNLFNFVDVREHSWYWVNQWHSSKIWNLKTLGVVTHLIQLVDLSGLVVLVASDLETLSGCLIEWTQRALICCADSIPAVSWPTGTQRWKTNYYD